MNGERISLATDATACCGCGACAVVCPGCLCRRRQGISVHHLLSDRMEDIRRMQGSKHVQSGARRCYPDVLDALRSGNRMLFSGTPCRAEAIRRLTGNPAKPGGALRYHARLVLNLLRNAKAAGHTED